MKRELENKLEERCVAKVEALGGLALKLGLKGVRGFPDRTVLLPDNIGKHAVSRSRIFFVELKREAVGVVSAQQAKWRRKLEAMGFHVYLIDNDADFDAVLEKWK